MLPSGKTSGRRIPPVYTIGMAQKGSRPVFLNLFRIRLPIGGVVSLLHRLTGVVLALSTPFLLYLLQMILGDAGAYAALAQALRSSGTKLLILSAAAILVLHFFSGLRHLLFDLDIGTGRGAARRTAWLVFGAAAVTVVALGISL